MRVLVCGGRSYPFDDAYRRLNKMFNPGEVDCIIHGGARGADEGAAMYAEKFGIECLEFKADWNTHGKAAGPMRNQKMIDEGKPDLVIAFPGGRGTMDMVSRAKQAGIPGKMIDASRWQPSAT